MARSTSPSSIYRNDLVAALVDFQKSQCYFASTVQVVAVILYYDTQTAVREFLTTVASDLIDYDVLDSTTMVVEATSGFVPTILTLACIERYGRRSWYLISLTLIT